METTTETTAAQRLRHAIDWLAQHAPETDVSVFSHAFTRKHDGPQVIFSAVDELEAMKAALPGRLAKCWRDDAWIVYAVVEEGILFISKEYKPREPDRTEWEVTL